MHTNRTTGYWPNLEWEDYQQRAEAALEDYPMAVALATFGIGLALGTAVGLMLSETVPEPRRTLSQQTWDAMSQYLPESVLQKVRA